MNLNGLETNIVSVEQYDNEEFIVFYREGKKVWHELIPFKPFFFTSENFKSKLTKPKVYELEGDLHYKYINIFKNWEDYQNRYKSLKYNDRVQKNSVYTFFDPKTQFLIQRKTNLFEGMTFKDTHVISVDIETYSKHGFPDPQRKEDKIIIIACKSNFNGITMLYHDDEKKLLKMFVDYMQEQDCDIVCGHNFYKFDMWFLYEKYKLHNIPFSVGRDKAEVTKGKTKNKRVADQMHEFTPYVIFGRHIVDTFFLVAEYDAIKRTMENHKLKYCAKHFGFASDDRIYLESYDNIVPMWDARGKKRKELIAYAEDDVHETLFLFEHLVGSHFEMTKVLPFSFQDILLMGSGRKIETLLVKEYFYNKHSFPCGEKGKQESGGYTDIFWKGRFKNIIYADIESLYPSIMLNYNIKPEFDDLNIFQDILETLTEKRLECKARMKKEKDPNIKQSLDGEQGAYKIIINSFYGYLGYTYGVFNDFSEADRVTTTGQEILRTLIKTVSDDGGIVIEADTDGILSVCPPNQIGTEKEYVESLTKHMPKGIIVGFDGMADTMLSFKKKNYALKGYDGKVKIKGGSLKSRGLEPIFKNFIKDAIHCLLENDIQKLHDDIVKIYNYIRYDKISVQDFSKTSTLKYSLDEYKYKLENSNTNRMAQYEVALKSDQEFVKGDRVTYYVAEVATDLDKEDNVIVPKLYKMKVFKCAKTLDTFNNDLRRDFYEKRFKTVCTRFKDFFTEEDYESLFGGNHCDTSLIKIKNTEL